MKNEKKGNAFSRFLAEIRETIFGVHPDDSSAKRVVKKVGWIMFLILMACGAAATLLAISFAH